MQNKKTALVLGQLQVDILLKKSHCWTDMNLIVCTNIGEHLDCTQAKYTNFVMLKTRQINQRYKKY